MDDSKTKYEEMEVKFDIVRSSYIGLWGRFERIIFESDSSGSIKRGSDNKNNGYYFEIVYNL